MNKRYSYEIKEVDADDPLNTILSSFTVTNGKPLSLLGWMKVWKAMRKARRRLDDN